MTTPARTAQQGTTLDLFIEVRDTEGVLVDSETDPVVSIFPFDADPRHIYTTDSHADILNDVSVTSVAQGVYSFSYAIAADAHVGTWFDRWVVTIDTVLCTAIFQFEVQPSVPVTDAASVETGTNPLLGNNVIVVTLDETIAASDGQFLPEDFQYYFTTEYSPLYSTIRKIRLRGGQYMKSVPDDTINLAIFEASLEADAITFGMNNPPVGANFMGYREGYTIGAGQINPTFFLSNRRGGQYFLHARTEYVTCMALIYILSNSLGPAAKKKSLADFSVDYGDSAIQELMSDLKAECRRWQDVIQSGGFITEGASLPPRVAQRGVFDPDAPRHGRRSLANNNLPAANTKVQSPNHRSRWKHTFKRRM